MKLIDFDKAKNEIIREIAESRYFHNTVRHICFKNGFTDNTKLTEDVKQEVIEKMLKKDAEFLYEMYVDNPNRPFSLACGIAKNQFRKHPKLIGYNKHSFGEYIIFTSNLKEDTLDAADSLTFTPEWQSTASADNISEPDKQHIIYYLINFLNPDEQEFIFYLLDKTKTKGKYTKEFRENKQKIFEKIRQIAKDKNLKFVF